jgi:hypothetical protein
MTKRQHLFGCTVVCSILFLSAAAPAQTLQVIDADGHATPLTMAQISALPHVTVDVRDHDKAAQFEGVALAPLLATAGIQLGDALRGPRMSEVLL